jgi:Ras-related protein Rab-8A
MTVSPLIISPPLVRKLIYTNYLGIDFKIKIINLEEKLIKLQIWDTAGQERFRTITKTYYKGAHGIILTYDVTDEASFKNIRNWVKQIEQNAQSNVCRVLVGNKCDRDDRKVAFETGNSLATEFHMKFFETSAKTNYNVNETFTFLTREILKTCDTRPSPNPIVIGPGQDKPGKKDKQKCCK